MQKLFLHGDPPVEITLRRTARARRMSLRVSQLDGKVTLTAPPGVRDRSLRGFVDEKADWIRKHLADHGTSELVGYGSFLPVEGEMVELVAGKSRAPSLAEGRMQVPGPDARVAARVAGFLKVRARERLSAASDRYAAMVGRSYGRMSIRDTRSRWGSCSCQGNLMYSWRLIMAPPEVLDYVAAHEVAHLREMNHGPAFWALVEQISPDYRDPRAWLRRNGAGLHRFRFCD